MFELPNKRKASHSPQSTEKSKKDRKAAKKEQKCREKVKQKAKLQLDLSPPSVSEIEYFLHTWTKETGINEYLAYLSVIKQRKYLFDFFFEKFC